MTEQALKYQIRDYMQGAGYSSDEGKWCEEVLYHATVTLVNETPELIFTVADCENRKHHIERIKQEASSCLRTPKQTHTHTQAQGSDMSAFKASSSLH